MISAPGRLSSHSDTSLYILSRKLAGPPAIIPNFMNIPAPVPIHMHPHIPAISPDMTMTDIKGSNIIFAAKEYGEKE